MHDVHSVSSLAQHGRLVDIMTKTLTFSRPCVSSYLTQFRFTCISGLVGYYISAANCVNEYILGQSERK